MALIFRFSLLFHKYYKTWLMWPKRPGPKGPRPKGPWPKRPGPKGPRPKGPWPKRPFTLCATLISDKCKIGFYWRR